MYCILYSLNSYRYNVQKTPKEAIPESNEMEVEDNGNEMEDDGSGSEAELSDEFSDDSDDELQETEEFEIENIEVAADYKASIGKARNVSQKC
jgi:hypothetical protein